MDIQDFIEKLLNAGAIDDTEAKELAELHEDEVFDRYGDWFMDAYEPF